MDDIKETREEIETETEPDDVIEETAEDEEDIFSEDSDTDTDEDTDGEDEEDADGDGEEDTTDYKALYEAEKNARASEKRAIEDALKAQGYNTLDEMIAESEGLTVDEYRKNKKDSETLAEAQRIVSENKYARQAREDLDALKRAGLVPETVSHITELKCVNRFAQLRDMGLSTIEAYRAAAGSELDERFDRAASRKAASKNHLKSSASRATSAQVPRMTDSERDTYRALLRTDDDKAIESAWLRAQGRKK